MRLFSFSIKKQRFNYLNSLLLDITNLAQSLFLILITSAKYLQQSCSFFILNITINKDLLEISVSKKHFLSLLYFLQKHSLTKHNMLIEYTVIDFPGKVLRFEIVLFLLSSLWNNRIKIRLFTNEFLSVHTVTHLFKVAFWQEREIWDMFGIIFQNHTDLRRILTDYGFLGHPLRKDFPLTGFVEIFFDDFSRNIITVPVSLAQEYRFYEFKNPWVKL